MSPSQSAPSVTSERQKPSQLKAVRGVVGKIKRSIRRISKSGRHHSPDTTAVDHRPSVDAPHLVNLAHDVSPVPISIPVSPRSKASSDSMAASVKRHGAKRGDADSVLSHHLFDSASHSSDAASHVSDAASQHSVTTSITSGVEEFDYEHGDESSAAPSSTGEATSTFVSAPDYAQSSKDVSRLPATEPAVADARPQPEIRINDLPVLDHVVASVAEGRLSSTLDSHFTPNPTLDAGMAEDFLDFSPPPAEVEPEVPVSFLEGEPDLPAVEEETEPEAAEAPEPGLSVKEPVAADEIALAQSPAPEEVVRQPPADDELPLAQPHPPDDEVAPPAHPSADGEVMSVQPVDEEVALAQPLADDEVVLAQPLTDDEVALAQPSADHEVALSQPAAEQVIADDEVALALPSADNDVVLSQPAADEEFAQPPADDEVPFEQPSADEDVPLAQPAVADEAAFAQPPADDEVALIEPPADDEVAIEQRFVVEEDALVQPPAVDEVVLAQPAMHEESVLVPSSTRALNVDKEVPPPPQSIPSDDEDEEETPELYLPGLIIPTMFLPIPNTDPLTTLLTKYISPEKRPLRDLTGEWQRNDLNTLVMTNSWRALARMARDRIVEADPEDLALILSLWSLRLSCLARLRLFNQTSAECTNLFMVLNAVEPAASREWLFDRVLPFELEVLYARINYWTGDHMGYLDALSALLKRCKAKARQAKGDVAGAAMWKERGARVCLIIASQLIEMKDFSAAAKLLEPLCKQDTDMSSPQLESAVGRIYVQGGYLSMAAKHFTAVARDPTAELSLKATNAALLASAEGNWTKAAEELKLLLAADPENYSAVNNLAVALLCQGKIQEGIRMLEEALRASPSTIVVAEPLVFNLSTMYELRSTAGVDKKRDLLVEVAKWAGDGMRTTCLKMPST